jgi:hypothetical protein
MGTRKRLMGDRLMLTTNQSIPGEINDWAFGIFGNFWHAGT